jgi:hypothetical protein
LSRAETVGSSLAKLLKNPDKYLEKLDKQSKKQGA